MTTPLWLPDDKKPYDPPKLKFQFACPMKWSDLAKTSDPNIRDCGKCKEQVHYVTSFSNFLDSVEKGRCVSVDMNDYGTLFASHRQDEKGPCVVKKEVARTEVQMPTMMGRTYIVDDEFNSSRKRGRVVRRPESPKKEG